MTSDEQLRLWVAGTSVHNETTGECVPDFSCCKPELQSSQETREAFMRANKEERMKFLGMFLGAALQIMFGEGTVREAYISGVSTPGEEN